MIAKSLGYMGLGLLVFWIISLPLGVFGEFLLCNTNLFSDACEDASPFWYAYSGLIGTVVFGFVGFFLYGVGRVASDQIDNWISAVQRRKKAKK